MTLFLIKDEIIEFNRDQVNRFRIDFMLYEIESAREILEHTSYLTPHHTEFWKKDNKGKITCCHYIGRSNQELYINISLKHIQIQSIEKSLLEELIDALNPNLFTDAVMFKDNVPLYPIERIFNKLY